MSAADMRQDPSPDDAPDATFRLTSVLDVHTGNPRVVVVGDLCPLTCPELRDLLDGLMTGGATTIVLDLAEVRLCTSHGVDLFDDVSERLTADGGDLRIEHATGVVRRVLDICGMSHEQPG